MQVATPWELVPESVVFRRWRSRKPLWACPLLAVLACCWMLLALFSETRITWLLLLLLLFMLLFKLLFKLLFRLLFRLLFKLLLTLSSLPWWCSPLRSCERVCFEGVRAWFVGAFWRGGGSCGC